MKKRFRRLMCLALSVVLVLSFSACASTGSTAPTNTDPTQATGEFDWKRYSGETIQFLAVGGLEYAQGITERIPVFEELTGINVEFSEIPEENYFDKITSAFSSKSGNPDVIMTGAYQEWEYAPGGYLVDLKPYIDNASVTSPDYDFGDIYDSIAGCLRWDCVTGHPTGEGGQWALPIGYELNNVCYNKRVFDEKGIEVPTTTEEFLETAKALNEFEGTGTYGLAVRGTRNWATIHPSYMAMYATFGAKDFEIQDGKLVSCMNSPEAVKATEWYVDLIKEAGTDQWASYTWTQCQADLGAGKCAMCWDADTTYFYMNLDGASKEAGNLAYFNAPIPEGKDKALSNLWIWALGMNADSKHKGAAWYFIQYFTSKEHGKYTIEADYCFDPPRKSTFEDPEFQAKLANQPGFKESFEYTVENAAMLFTPTPMFFEITTEWAATLQDIVGGQYSSVQEGMDALKAKVDEMVKDLPVE